MRFAYADPPYIGQAKRHYAHDPSGIMPQEVDHGALIARLVKDFPDGWALSSSSPSLREILPLCPSEARVMAWVKPFCSFKPNVRIAYAWEPGIICGGRPRVKAQETVRDWVSANMTMRRGTHGAKPDAFCYALFEWLNMQTGDEFVDVFPGSGAVMRAWCQWLAQPRLTAMFGGMDESEAVTP
jgi:hypothetical protein